MLRKDNYKVDNSLGYGVRQTNIKKHTKVRAIGKRMIIETVKTMKSYQVLSSDLKIHLSCYLSMFKCLLQVICILMFVDDLKKTKRARHRGTGLSFQYLGD